MVEDRVPPHNSDIERAVLGAMLIGNADTIETVKGVIEPEDFYTTAHGFVASAIYNLHTKGVRVDQISVVDALTRDGKLDQAGGAVAVCGLAGEMATTHNVEYHSTLVRDFAIRRGMGQLWQDLYGKSFDQEEDIEDLIDSSITKAVATDLGISVNTPPTHLDVMAESLQFIEDRSADPEAYRGASTGIVPLDQKLLGGLKRGELSIIAARPSVGKTALGLSVALGAVASGTPVLFISVEMGTRSLGFRLLAIRSGLDLSVFAREDLPDHFFEAACGAGVAYPDEQNLYIDDRTCEPVAMSRVVKKAVKDLGVKLVVVDYLQLMDPPKGTGRASREEQVSATAKIFKKLAKDLDIHVLSLAQLNRSVEMRDDKKPLLSDLRESGAIEQDSDVVMLLWRPSYYGIQQIDLGSGNFVNTAGYLEVNIAKHRNGPTGNVELYYDLRTGRFEAWGDRE